MKIRIVHIPLLFIGGALIWLKYPTQCSGLVSLFFSLFLIIYWIYFGVITFNFSKHNNHLFDFVSIIITGLIFLSLSIIYFYDDVDRLPIFIEAHQEEYKDKKATNFNGYISINLFKNYKYQVRQSWGEGGCQYRGKYNLIGDTIIFENKIIYQTDSTILTKYLINKNIKFLYNIDSKTNKIDTFNKLKIDNINWH